MFAGLCNNVLILVLLCCPVRSILTGDQPQDSSFDSNHEYLRINSKYEEGESDSELLDCNKLPCEIYNVNSGTHDERNDQIPSESIHYNIVTYQNSSGQGQPITTTIKPSSTQVQSSLTPGSGSTPLDIFDAVLHEFYKYRSYIPMILIITAAPIVLTVITILTIHAIFSYFIKSELVNRLAEAEEVLYFINSASKYQYSQRRPGHGHGHHGYFGPFDDDHFFYDNYYYKKRKGQKLINTLENVNQSGLTNFNFISNNFSSMILPLISFLYWERWLRSNS